MRLAHITDFSILKGNLRAGGQGRKQGNLQGDEVRQGKPDRYF